MNFSYFQLFPYLCASLANPQSPLSLLQAAVGEDFTQSILHSCQSGNVSYTSSRKGDFLTSHRVPHLWSLLSAVAEVARDQSSCFQLE